jgi:demethylmenaquinone methyltransferase / 2-methoxy-6-polyprenyl-1,4-benzoquinol methylase
MTDKPLRDQLTDFGYQQVPPLEKTKKVAEVFHSVAKRYDIMNDLMSFGAHRLWKRFAITLANPKPHDKILDLAGGTGDLTKLLAKKLSQNGLMILSDINESMLTVGRDRLIDAGFGEQINYAQINAEALPFTSDTFNLITIGFGLRNVTDKHQALTEMYRVLKPAGKVFILEFSKPVINALNPLYDFYSFKILPQMGQWIAKDKESYAYLAESIRMHPSQEDLKTLMTEAGFDKVEYYNLSAGIVALHVGYKF